MSFLLRNPFRGRNQRVGASAPGQYVGAAIAIQNIVRRTAKIQSGLKRMLHAMLADEREEFEKAFEEVVLGKIVNAVAQLKEAVREEWAIGFKSLKARRS